MQILYISVKFISVRLLFSILNKYPTANTKQTTYLQQAAKRPPFHPSRYPLHLARRSAVSPSGTPSSASGTSVGGRAPRAPGLSPSPPPSVLSRHSAAVAASATRAGGDEVPGPLTRSPASSSAWGRTVSFTVRLSFSCTGPWRS